MTLKFLGKCLLYSHCFSTNANNKNEDELVQLLSMKIVIGTLQQLCFIQLYDQDVKVQTLIS